MKKILVPIIAALLFLTFQMQAQQIQNSGFESWTMDSIYEDPTGYISDNFLYYMLVSPYFQETKISDSYSGNYAVKLETNLLNTDTMPAILHGNLPYSDKPDSFKGFVKYDIGPSDTATIEIYFYQSYLSDSILGYAIIPFIDSQVNYIEFSVPINWKPSGGNPDSMTVFISSSVDDDPNQIPGSHIYVDKLGFNSGFDPIPNGDFESWTCFCIDKPDDWYSTNIVDFMGIKMVGGEFPYSKSTDSYEGSFALKLENVALTSFFSTDTFGTITNGELVDFSPKGGMPVTNNPALITGYYKYIPVGLDTAFALTNTSRYDLANSQSIILEENIITLPPSTNYTYFEIPFTYDDSIKADTLNLSFTAGNYSQGSSRLGSTLYLDSLNIVYYSTPTRLSKLNKIDKFNLFPNPASEVINLKITEGFEGQLTIEIVDINGKILKSRSIDNNKQLILERIDLSEFQNGVYYVKIADHKSLIVKEFMIFK